MQILQYVFKIEDPERKDNLLEILSDKYCRTILESTMNKSKSAIEISADSNIPMSTIYRRIQTLRDNNLVKTSGIITQDGKRLFMYKSKIKGIQSVFNDGKIEVELILNN